ncbi:MAG: class I SAM-dependent methyltransferase [Betaproteobacteria bacterium]|nr:class I SAM-dependent methyltransferase [Betaproteobacteria bacterium]
MSETLLRKHHAVWKAKPVLRRLYTGWYRDIAAQLRPGRTLEVGGGSGNLKEFAPHVICTDVVRVPWLDAVVDAQRLPFASGSLDNIVLFDALHHLEHVALFFDEAVRVLRAGGRIVMMEPYVSWCSWPIYRFLHPEPLDLGDRPLEPRPSQAGRKPFDANQAIPTILFERRSDDFRRRYPGLTVVARRRLAFFAYPLSGGFDHPSLIPESLVAPLTAVESALECLGGMLAFRLLVALEKTA